MTSFFVRLPANNMVTCMHYPLVSLTLSPVALTETVSYVVSSYSLAMRLSFLELLVI